MSEVSNSMQSFRAEIEVRSSNWNGNRHRSRSYTSESIMIVPDYRSSSTIFRVFCT